VRPIAGRRGHPDQLDCGSFRIWTPTDRLAAIVVAIDHYKAIRDLDIGMKTVLARWQAFSVLAEALVVSDSPNRAKGAVGGVSTA